ncbi:hypothetical protein Nepgr_006922 [Nepenthes gracilis]|uniref:Uncharacterized protein n=1 Tax=Nepenthes gracilis TaxID=150966 RepID=A0AAD3XHS6_NEPGR|nr:hypothetical protein Nepgr_006922 [Nepenthes gracilis]
MMEWCLGQEVDDFVVPKDEDFWDRLPSPDSLWHWGINEPESFGWPDDIGAIKIATLHTEKLPKKLLFGEVGSQSSQDGVHSCGSDVNGGWTQDSPQRIHTTHDWPCFQFDDPMDDLFLYRVMPSDGSSTSMMSNLCCVSCNQQSECFGDCALSQSAGRDTGQVTTYNDSDNIDQSDGPSVKVLIPSDENGGSACLSETTSLDEYVLQEFEAVLTQLSEKTRLCFRDSLYRLAHNSNWQLPTQGLAEGAPDGSLRSRQTEAAESETNCIDRAVANLMFNKMDTDAPNLHPAMSAKVESCFLQLQLGLARSDTSFY